MRHDRLSFFGGIRVEYWVGLLVSRWKPVLVTSYGGILEVLYVYDVINDFCDKERNFQREV